MIHFKNEKGFSSVELVLVLVVVVLLGLGGWFVYKKNQQKPASNNSTKTSTSEEKPSSQDSKEETETTPPVSDAKYLTIKEWGIKIKMEDADKLTYVMNGTPNGEPNNDATTSYASLRLKDSVSVPDACRSFGPTVVQATAATNATKIGNYYYGFMGGYDDCGDATADALRKKIATQELVLSAIEAE